MIELLSSNWLVIAALVLFVLMHRSGHGCRTEAKGYLAYFRAIERGP